jgi:hemoglobin
VANVQETTSLFERLGGDAAVGAAVEVFYGKVLADEHLKAFFAGTDMARQKQHMGRFLAFACGGPKTYTGRDMRSAHQRLVTTMGLNDSHFDAVVAHLVATLQELDVAPEVIGEAGMVVESVRDDVLNRPAPAA